MIQKREVVSFICHLEVGFKIFQQRSGVVDEGTVRLLIACEDW